MTESTVKIASALESAIATNLPSYMVPTIYLPLATMPMTSSGKLDRRQLRQMCESLSDEQALSYRLATKTGRAPATKMEKALAHLWETTLELKPNSVSADDNFFRLSGDSISAMRLIGMARSQAISLSVASIFQKPKLGDLSKVATFSTKSSTESDDLRPFSLLKNVASLADLKDQICGQCRIEIKDIQDIYPCTAMQASQQRSLYS